MTGFNIEHDKSRCAFLIQHISEMIGESHSGVFIENCVNLLQDLYDQLLTK